MSSHLRIAVMGGLGHMGQKVAQIIKTDPNCVQTAIIHHHPIDKTHTIPPILKGIKVLSHIQDLDPISIDIVVDFSLPQGFIDLTNWCGQHQVKFVSGITGLSKKDKQALDEAAQSVACLYAPNMSLGVNLIAQIIPLLKPLSDYDFQIVEAHHNNKKDKPSGTALLLHNILKSQVSSKAPDPLSLRGGGIAGQHEIWCMGKEEVIKIQHTALDWSVFARGTITAAKWLIDQPPGLYSMKDVFSSQLKDTKN